ncbi:MAG: endonuclease Q family protein [Candidatus Zapsychrus exili]|nr:endonuclease Q family protein [Candidatus Zapsychrus exili]
MKFYADLHIHSHYSRATSKNLNLIDLSYWARIKGIKVIGTGDFSHPGWLKEIKENLEPAEDGLFKLRDELDILSKKGLPKALHTDVRFMLTAEISNIYKKLDKVRKVHNIIFAPSFEAAEKIQVKLGQIGNIISDGRPILGLDSKSLLEIVLESDDYSFLVPAHIWTPWFSIMGSKSGFDRVEDCFDELTKHIFALETGLSSDPPMNWRLSQLDDYALISNSDAHSAQKLGRESNIFDCKLSYREMYNALRDKDNKGLLGTVEFFPEEGKYHYDGHRSCKSRLHPKETISNKGLCPVCKKPATVGVMARVEELADNEDGRKSKRWREFYSLIPLIEIIADSRGVGPNSKVVFRIYMDMISKLGNEMGILMDISINEIEKAQGSLIAEGIRRVRNKDIEINAGYDGEYGKIKIFSDKERAK